MPEHCGSGPTIEEEEAEYERARQERIDRYYQGESAADLAERVVDLEDELGADDDGVCSGMHADVAEAQSEVERLTALLGYWEHRAEESAEEVQRLARDLRIADAKIGGAALFVDRTQARINMLENVVTAYDDIHGERDRYQLAWLSARRRAADEANFGMEALALRDAEIARLRAELRQTTSAPRLSSAGADDEGGEIFKLVDTP